MSQSRFSIVLVGVSALLRRPLVSRLRPADGERSSWVVFAARGCRFDSELPPSASEIALGGLAFGLTASAFGTHRFGIALGGLAFGFTASAFRHAPLRRLPSAGCFFRLPLRRLPSAGWPSGSLLPLFGMRRFGVAARRLVFPPSASELPLGGLAFGLTASAFRHAPIRTAVPPKRGPTEHNDTTLVSLQTLIPTC